MGAVSRSLRVLGIDPGLTRCGIGVVDVSPNRTASLVHVGVARSAPGDPIEKRLAAIAAGIREVLVAHQPHVVAVERVFAQNNRHSVMGTAQASGIALLLAAEHGLTAATHTPSEVKAAITGYGSADKLQVQTMVARVLRLDALPAAADAADASQSRCATRGEEARRRPRRRPPSRRRSGRGGRGDAREAAFSTAPCRSNTCTNGRVGSSHDLFAAWGGGARRRRFARGRRRRRGLLGRRHRAVRAHGPPRRRRPPAHQPHRARRRLSLYGFETREELTVFTQLISVTASVPNRRSVCCRR